MTESDKHSSLLGFGINCGQNIFMTKTSLFSFHVTKAKIKFEEKEREKERKKKERGIKKEIENERQE